MALCCENHDRLDRLLHAEEHVGNVCGSMKNVRVGVPGGGPQDFNLTGEQKPAYCCPDCPTLIAVHRAGASA